MFGRKKKEALKITVGRITIINHIIRKKGTNYPVKIREFINASEIIHDINYYFRYYEYLLNSLPNGFHLSVHFIDRKKRIFMNSGPFIKNTEDFVKKFLLLVFWAFFINLFLYIFYTKGFMIWPIVVLSVLSFLVLLIMPSISTYKFYYLIYILSPILFTSIILVKVSSIRFAHVLFIQAFFAVIFSLTILFIRIDFRKRVGKILAIGAFANLFLEKDGSEKVVIKIYKPRLKNKEVFLNGLFHELDHVLWHVEGKEFDNTNYYEERPHEKRANERSVVWSAGNWENGQFVCPLPRILEHPSPIFNFKN